MSIPPDAPFHLTLLRHGQSDPIPGLRDFDRPLTEMGAACVQEHAKTWVFNPPIDSILCSGSRRTRETLDLILPQLTGAKVSYDDDLFLAPPKYLIQRIERMDDRFHHLLVVAHGPTLQGVANWLQGIQGNTLHFEPGTCVHLRLNIHHWRDFAPYCQL